MKYPIVQVISASAEAKGRDWRPFATLLARPGRFSDEIVTALEDRAFHGRLKIFAHLDDASKIHGFDDAPRGLAEGGYPLVSVILIHERDLETETLRTRLTDAPPAWTPLVVVACRAANKTVKDVAQRLLPVLDKQFPGADISFVDVDPERRPDFWWWRLRDTTDQQDATEQPMVDILTTGFGRPSRDMEKVLEGVRAADVTFKQRRRGAGASIIEPTETTPGPEVAPRAVILDLTEKWAFVGGDGLSKATRDEAGQKREAFLAALQLLQGQGASEFRSILPRGKSGADLHPALLDQLGPEPLLLPVTVSRPLLWQIKRLPPETLLGLSENAALAGIGENDPQRLEAKLTAYRGAHEVLHQQLELARARGGGEMVTQLTALVQQARADLLRIADFGFESLIRDVRGGAYPGTEGRPNSRGSRKGESWKQHFPFWSHLRTRWSKLPDAGDKKKYDHDNWVVSERQSQTVIPRLLNRRIEITANDRAKEVLSQAIAIYCAEQIAATGALCDVYFSLALRGEAREMLIRQRATPDSDPQNLPELPEAMRRPDGIAAAKALSIVADTRLRDAVPRHGWPVIGNMPHILNFDVLSKSIRTLLRQATKFGIFFGAFIGSVYLARGSDPNQITDPIVMMKDWLGRFQIPWTDIPLSNTWVIWSAAIVATLVLVWNGFLELRFQQSEKLDKLRDDTLRVIEDAAAKQIAQARLAFLAVLEDDLAAFHAQMLTEIQRHDRAHLNTIPPRLRRIEDEIKRLEPLVRSADKTVNANHANVLRLLRGKLMLGQST